MIVQQSCKQQSKVYAARYSLSELYQVKIYSREGAKGEYRVATWGSFNDKRLSSGEQVGVLYTGEVDHKLYSIIFTASAFRVLIYLNNVPCLITGWENCKYRCNLFNIRYVLRMLFKISYVAHIAPLRSECDGNVKNCKCTAWRHVENALSLLWSAC